MIYNGADMVAELVDTPLRLMRKKRSSTYRAFGLTLWIAVLVVSFTVTPAHAKVPDNKYAVALVIGNKSYVNKRIPAVEYAHNDAAAMIRYLIDVQGYRKANIIDLRDATQAQMEAALGNARTHEGKLWQWLRPGKSDVTVFYSGHGLPGLKDRRGYMLPIDADPEKPEINGYPLDVLYANLAKLKVRSVTVYLDTCFSGDSGGGILVRSASGLVVTPKLPKSSARVTVLTAAMADQVASWDEKNKHGLFTHHLLAALYGQADGNADGRVSAGEVKAYLDDEMTYAARRTYGRKQTASLQGNPAMVLGPISITGVSPRNMASLIPPTLEIEPLDETYIVIKTANVRDKPNAKSKKITTLRLDTSVQVTGKTKDGKWLRIAHSGQDAFIWTALIKPIDAAELAAWNKLRGSSEKSALEGFLSDYPSGHFAPHVKLLMAAIQQARAARQVAAVKPSVSPAPVAAQVAPQPAVSQSAAALPAGTPKEQYTYAFNLLRNTNYDQAEIALKQFIAMHGGNPLTGNARYWLGETFYVRADYQQSAQVFFDGFQSDPKGSKAPDMLLKLGMSLGQLKKKNEACATFDKVAADFAKSSSRIKTALSRERKRVGCP
jgi:tol-pal system protein YbgF